MPRNIQQVSSSGKEPRSPEAQLGAFPAHRLPQPHLYWEQACASDDARHAPSTLPRAQPSEPALMCCPHLQAPAPSPCPSVGLCCPKHGLGWEGSGMISAAFLFFRSQAQSADKDLPPLCLAPALGLPCSRLPGQSGAVVKAGDKPPGILVSPQLWDGDTTRHVRDRLSPYLGNMLGSPDTWVPSSASSPVYWLEQVRSKPVKPKQLWISEPRQGEGSAHGGN